MRARLGWLAIVLACVLGSAGCSKTAKVVAPQPQVVGGSEFEYSLQFSNQQGGYTVSHVQYADADGVVRQSSYQGPLWVQTVKLKPGQRMYVRADVSFDAVLTGSAQIVGPDGFYRGDRCERVDGPGAATVEIDQILK
jgi:hypothetical protein